MTGPGPEERRLARALRLKGQLPVPVRLSRRAVALTAGVAVAALAGVAGWALTGRRPPPSAETAAPVPARAPEPLALLPKDYAGLPAGVPRLGPPLPGDLGRPLPAAGGGLAPADDPGGRPGDAAARRDEALRQARASGLFAPGGRAAPSPGSEVAAPGPAAGSVGGPSRLQAPASPYLLQAGASIPAALTGAIRSDLPGPVTAQVTENVYDSLAGRYLLVPQGSRLVGAYDRGLAFGQSRVLVSWSRLVLPDGRSVDLAGAPAADVEGQAGLPGRIDRRWGQVLAAALASLGVAAVAELSAASAEEALWRALRSGSVDVASQVGGRAVSKALDVAPTVTVPAGSPVRALLIRDLVLEPWTAE